MLSRNEKTAKKGWAFLLGNLKEGWSGSAENSGGKTRSADDRRSHAACSKCLDHKFHPTRRAMTQWPLIYTVLGHRSVAAISNLDHGCGIPTNKGAKRCPLVLERGHRSPEHRQRRLRHRTSSSGIWLRQYSSNDDQGTLPPFLRCHIPGSYLIRTRWPTTPTTSSSG